MVEPLRLKASGSHLAGQEVDGAVSMSLSRAWAVKKTQRGIYTGGKVALLALEDTELQSPPDEYLVTMYGSDVVLSDVENGQVVALISCGEGEGKEEIIAFAAHPSGQEIATASRNLMLRYWDWRSPAGPVEPSTAPLSGQSFRPRCMRAYKAHETPVLAMEYDSTGTLVATGGSDRSVQVWDVPGGFCTHNFRGHTGIVTLVAFHPESAQRELLFSASDDCTVRVWSLREGGRAAPGGGGGCCLQVLTNHMSTVTGVGVSEDGNTLLTAGRDQIVSVWDLRRASPSAPGSTTGSFRGADLVTLVETVPVYEELEGLLALTEAEAQAMGGFGAWKGSEYGGRATEAELDSLHAMRHNKRGAGRKAGGGDSTAPPPRKGVFVLAGAKGKVRVFQYEPKVDVFAKGLVVRCVAEQAPRDTCPRGLSGILRGGRRRPTQLLAVTTDHNLQWLRGGDLAPSRVVVGYNDQVIAVKYLPGLGGGRDGRRVVVASNSPQVRVFRLDDLSCECLLEGQHTETVLAVDVSPDGRWVVTGGKDRSVCLWQLGPAAGAESLEEGQHGDSECVTGRCVRRYEGHTDAVSAVAVGRKKAAYQLLASGKPGGAAVAYSAGADRTLKRWLLAPPTPKPARHQDLRQKEANGKVEEHGQGKGSAGAPSVPSTTEASASVLAHDKDINALAVSPNDALVASASQDKTVKLWEARDLRAVGVLKGHKRGVWCVEFSPVDRCVVTGSGDKTVRLWSLTDFSCLRSLEGHTASVLAATFLRSGLQVLSAGADGLLKLWTVHTQQCEATMDGHEERVWALALSPDGRQAVTGGGDSAVNVWEDVTLEEEEQALRAAEAMVEKEQSLQNAAFRKDYFKAVRLALELGRPYRLLKVLQDILEAAPSASTDTLSLSPTSSLSTALDPYILEWGDADILQVLGYVREWNTNAKHAMIAQTILHALLRLLPHARLKKCCASQPSLLGGLLAYTERHLARADRLIQGAYLIDYTLSGLQVLFPFPAEEASEGKGPRPQTQSLALPSTPGPEEGIQKESQVPERREDGKKGESEEDEESTSSSSSSASGEEGDGEAEELSTQAASSSSPSQAAKGKAKNDKKNAPPAEQSTPSARPVRAPREGSGRRQGARTRVGTRAAASLDTPTPSTSRGSQVQRRGPQEVVEKSKEQGREKSESQGDAGIRGKRKANGSTGQGRDRKRKVKV